MSTDFKHTDPTFLRTIYDGLVSGSLHKDNTAALPAGLVGIYEEALPPESNVNKRKEFLEFFAVWTLLKKEVSAAFVSQLLGWTEERVLDYIALYSKWFNAPLTGKYALYHERLRSFVLQKISHAQFAACNEAIIKLGQKALERRSGDEWEQYALEHLSTHLLIQAMESKDATALKTQAYSRAHWNRQVEISKGFEWSKCMLNDMILWASIYDDDEVIECALNKVDLYHQEQNDAPRIMELVAQNDIETALQRIETFGGNDKEGLQRKFTLYMLCLMDLTLLDSKDKSFRKEAIEKLLKHLDDNLSDDHSVFDWIEFYPFRSAVAIFGEFIKLGVSYSCIERRTSIDFDSEIVWVVCSNTTINNEICKYILETHINLLQYDNFLHFYISEKLFQKEIFDVQFLKCTKSFFLNDQSTENVISLFTQIYFKTDNYNAFLNFVERIVLKSDLSEFSNLFTDKLIKIVKGKFSQLSVELKLAFLHIVVRIEGLSILNIFLDDYFKSYQSDVGYELHPMHVYAFAKKHRCSIDFPRELFFSIYRRALDSSVWELDEFLETLNNSILYIDNKYCEEVIESIELNSIEFNSGKRRSKSNQIKAIESIEENLSISILLLSRKGINTFLKDKEKLWKKAYADFWSIEDLYLRAGWSAEFVKILFGATDIGFVLDDEMMKLNSLFQTLEHQGFYVEDLYKNVVKSLARNGDFISFDKYYFASVIRNAGESSFNRYKNNIYIELLYEDELNEEDFSALVIFSEPDFVKYKELKQCYYLSDSIVKKGLEFYLSFFTDEAFKFVFKADTYYDFVKNDQEQIIVAELISKNKGFTLEDLKSDFSGFFPNKFYLVLNAICTFDHINARNLLIQTLSNSIVNIDFKDCFREDVKNIFSHYINRNRGDEVVNLISQVFKDQSLLPYSNFHEILFSIKSDFEDENDYREFIVTIFLTLKEDEKVSKYRLLRNKLCFLTQYSTDLGEKYALSFYSNIVEEISSISEMYTIQSQVLFEFWEYCRVLNISTDGYLKKEAILKYYNDFETDMGYRLDSFADFIDKCPSIDFSLEIVNSLYEKDLLCSNLYAPPLALFKAIKERRKDIVFSFFTIVRPDFDLSGILLDFFNKLDLHTANEWCNDVMILFKEKKNSDITELLIELELLRLLFSNLRYSHLLLSLEISNANEVKTVYKSLLTFLTVIEAESLFDKLKIITSDSVFSDWFFYLESEYFINSNSYDGALEYFNMTSRKHWNLLIPRLLNRGELQLAFDMAEKHSIHVDHIRSYIDIVLCYIKRGDVVSTNKAIACIEKFQDREKVFYEAALLSAEMNEFDKMNEHVSSILSRFLKLECVRQIGKKRMKTFGFDFALSNFRIWENNDFVISYLKGAHEDLLISQISKEIVLKLLHYSKDDFNFTKIILAKYALNKLFFAEMDIQLMEKFKRTLNIQWALDINKSPNAN